jgi:hypothetical protein
VIAADHWPDTPLPGAGTTAGITQEDKQERTAGAEESKSDKKSASTVLVETAQERYRFGVSDTGETFGVPKTGPEVVLLLRGGKTSLRAQLARHYFATTGKAAPQQALADALLVIEGIAQEANAETLYLRTARHDDALWLDLGDSTGKAVQITAAGWTVQDQAPVLFKRTSLTAPLPEPVRGGGLELLWEWLNVAKLDRPLVLAWLIAVLYHDIPHPVLGLFGEQGTGKSTAMKLVVLVVDPSAVPARKPPRDPESWVTAASGSWVVGLDNLSDMQPWLSDSICRAVTGDGDVRRKLYTDGDLAVFAFRRCVVLNGIDLGALRGDLADRMLPVELSVIGEDKRRDEGDLWPKWREVHPLILGALLDLAAGVAGVVGADSSVRLERTPRMADFARILSAVDEVQETAGMERYLATQTSLATDSLTGDLFITAIATALADRALSTFAGENDGDSFKGTAADLLKLVTPDATTKWRPPKGWPATPREVTQRLKRQAPPMRKAGWKISDDDAANRSKAIMWTIARPPEPENATGAATREAGNSDPRHPRHPHKNKQEATTAGVAGVAGVDSGPLYGDVVLVASSGGASVHSPGDLGPCLGCGIEHHRYGGGGSSYCTTCRPSGSQVLTA